MSSQLGGVDEVQSGVAGDEGELLKRLHLRARYQQLHVCRWQKMDTLPLAKRRLLEEGA
jgi:hypothetical protein